MHDLIVVELLKNEVAQEKTNQIFEKKLASFINGTIYSHLKKEFYELIHLSLKTLVTN